MASFTPIASTLGGVLLGLGAGLLMLLNGRIAGVSGVLGGAIVRRGADRDWRIAFVLGLLVGGVLLALVAPGSIGPVAQRSYPVLAIAGLLVGYGTRLANGCTSGHGVCGLGRSSLRSLVAVGTFMTVAAAVLFVTRHVLRAGAL